MGRSMSLSLAERERRAKERAAPKKGKNSPGGKAPVAEESGSLFDKYAGLAGRDTSEEDEVAELMEMLGTSPGSQRMSARQLTGQEEMYREAGWDPSPHRNPPPSLKYIKPQTREPWAIDAAVYNTAPGAVDTSDFGQPTRYGMDMDPPLSQWRIDDKTKYVPPTCALGLVGQAAAISRCCRAAAVGQQPHHSHTPFSHHCHHVGAVAPWPAAHSVSHIPLAMAAGWLPAHEMAHAHADAHAHAMQISLALCPCSSLPLALYPWLSSDIVFSAGSPADLSHSLCRRVAAKPGLKKPAPEWNSKPFKSVPYTLRGIKPAPSSSEPWVDDHKKRRGNFEDMDAIKDDGIALFDNGGGEAQFKNFDAGGWDSSTVTPWRSDGRYGRVRGIN